MTANASICNAFHELTMTLLGLFEVYDAQPELVEHEQPKRSSQSFAGHIGAPQLAHQARRESSPWSASSMNSRPRSISAKNTHQPRAYPPLEQKEKTHDHERLDTASRLADKHANQGGIFVRLTSKRRQDRRRLLRRALRPRGRLDRRALRDLRSVYSQGQVARACG